MNYMRFKKTNLISLISLDEYIEQNNDYSINSEKTQKVNNLNLILKNKN